MATIDHSNIIDLRELATLATECGEEIADTDTDAEDVTDAKETLAKLAELCADLGRAVDEEDAEDVASALEALGNEYGALIAEDYFEAYARDYTEEVQEIPDWILGHIDWTSVAREMSMDYTSITFDGEDYYIR